MFQATLTLSGSRSYFSELLQPLQGSDLSTPCCGGEPRSSETRITLSRDSNMGTADLGPIHTVPLPVTLQWAAWQNTNLRTGKPELVPLPLSSCKVLSRPAASLGPSPRVLVGMTRPAWRRARENTSVGAGHRAVWTTAHSVSTGRHTPCTSHQLRGWPSST